MPSWTETALDSDLTRYLSFIGLSILYYDYFLSLGIEISWFWSSTQLSLGFWVFLFNRYLPIFGHIPIIAEMLLNSPNHAKCRALQSYHQYLVVIVQAVVVVVMIMRMYALYGRSCAVVLWLSAFAAVLIVFGAWSIASGYNGQTVVVPQGSIGCSNGLSFNQAWHFGMAWAGVLVFDAVVFGMTLHKTLKIGRTGRRTLVDVLLRDGTVYFAVLGLAHFANVMTFVLGKVASRGIATILTNSLASTCASRLMLNVRDPKIQWMASTEETTYPFVPTVIDLNGPSYDAFFEADTELDGIELTPRQNVIRFAN